MGRKKRILILSENSSLHSGFGNYAKELAQRLYNTGKYELAELVCYSQPTDSELQNSKWLMYANGPGDGDEADNEHYKKNEANQFGLWRFDRTILDFKPDFVLTYRDPWMDQFVAASALRDYFYWIWMPTVDSAPQRPYWIDTFIQADAVLTYSEFGSEVLRKQGNDKINLLGCASPAVDENVFKPILDKRTHRQQAGLDPDWNIIGTVMRNQKRKLFPDLMQAFRQFLDTAPKDIAKKTYLYLHTSYPEKNGWDIPECIIENNLSSKILTSYVCRACRYIFPSFFHDARTYCKRCGQLSCILPNVTTGASTEELVKIFNYFDLYIQYAICEGFGIPLLEAAVCGIPTMAVDWTAMSDVIRHCKGQPIKPLKIFRELETGADRCYPNNDHLVECLIKFFMMPQQIRRQKGFQSRQSALKRYNWNDTAKKWENAIDSAVLKNRQGKWDAPLRSINTDIQIPRGLNSAELVQWVYAYLTHQNEDGYQLKGSTTIRDLNFSANFSYGYLEAFNAEKFLQRIIEFAKHQNIVEELRCGMKEMQTPFYISMAHRNVQK